MLCLHNVWSFHFKSQPHQVDDGGHRPSFLYWTNMSHYFPPAWGGWQGCHCFSTLSIQIIATFILSSILFPPLISFSKVSIMRKAGDILFAFLFQIFIFQVLTFCWGALHFPGARNCFRCISFSWWTTSVTSWKSFFFLLANILFLFIFQIDVNCLPRSDRTTLGSGASLGPFLSVSQSFSTARTRLGQVRTSTLLHYRWWTTYLTTTLSRRSTWRRATASRQLPVRFPQWRSQIWRNGCSRKLRTTTKWSLENRPLWYSPLYLILWINFSSPNVADALPTQKTQSSLQYCFFFFSFRSMAQYCTVLHCTV